ncbi:MAG: restriction endonuclease [Porticoccaceae bacterium]
MARRKQSFFEDIMEITSRFPWWVGVLLAMFSYLIFHYLAGVEVRPPDGKRIIESSYILKSVGVSLSHGLQYVFPIFFFAGALVSAILSLRKKKLYGHLKQNPVIQTLQDMSWKEFELLVGQYFTEQGFTVRQNVKSGPDGGVDLVVLKDAEKYLVQCKQWRSTKVGVEIVRELLGAIAAQGAVGGFVVTSGRFTEPAKDFVKGRNIELVDGNLIVSKVGNVPPTLEGTTINQPETIPQTHPSCLKCGSPMVKRKARKGANTGNEFWGCSTFPECRGVRKINS